MTRPTLATPLLRRDFLALAATLAVGCGATDRSGPLRIAAASDLQKALPLLVAEFRKGRKVEIETTFGASGQLAEQIAQGAPFDVFLSANEGFVRSLARSGVIREDSVQPYATGSLVMVIYKASGVEVATPSDLMKPEIKKVAIANPDLAPYGFAAKQVLERAKLWDTLEPKIVRAETVLQAMQFVSTGNAEVGFVGWALADHPAVRFVPVAPEAHDPIVQSLGIVAGTTHREDADAFAAFLVSPAAQRQLADLGFGPPPRPSPQ